MLAGFVVILLVFHGAANADTACEAELMKGTIDDPCLEEVDNLPPMLGLPTEEELKHICPVHKNSLECVRRRTIEACWTGYVRVEAIERVEHIDNEIDTFNYICDEDSSGHKSYLEERECLEDVLKARSQKCERDSIKAYEDFEKYQVAKIGDIDQFTSWEQYFCLTTNIEVVCLLKAVEEGCGEGAKDFATEFSYKSKLSQQSCRNLNYKYVKPILDYVAPDVKAYMLSTETVNKGCEYAFVECLSHLEADIFEQIRGLPNADQLEEACPHVRNFFTCGRVIIEVCGAEYFHLDIIDTEEDIDNIIKTIHVLCHNDSSIHEQYVENVQCIKGSLRGRGEELFQALSKLYDDIEDYQVGKVGPVSTDIHRKQFDCVMANFLSSCLPEIYTKTCGDDAGYLTAELFLKSNIIELACRDAGDEFGELLREYEGTIPDFDYCENLKSKKRK